MKLFLILIVVSFLFGCRERKNKFDADIVLTKSREIILSEENNPIGVVSSARFSEDSTLYLLDISASDIKVYDFFGKYIKRIGGKGKGPDQLLSPRNFCVSKEHVVVGDLGNYTFKWFSLETGKVSKIYTFKKYRPVFGESILFENQIITTGLWDGRQTYEDAVLILDSSGNVKNSVGKYPAEYPEYQKLDGTAYIDINQKGDLLISFIQSPSISIINLLNGTQKTESFEINRGKYVSEKFKQDKLTMEEFEKINLSICYNTCIRYFNDTLIVRGFAKHNEKSVTEGSFINAFNSLEIYSDNFEKIGEFEIKGTLRDVKNGFIVVEECDEPNKRIYAFYKINVNLKK